MGKKPRKAGDDWAEAKRRCRISDEEVRMAKELGIKPRSLIKNIPAKSQPWKAPVPQGQAQMSCPRLRGIALPPAARGLYVRLAGGIGR